MNVPIQNIATPLDIRSANLAEAHQNLKTARAQSAPATSADLFAGMVQGKDSAMGAPAQASHSTNPRPALRMASQQSTKIDAAIQGLDAALIRNMLENMQSSEASSLFGEGTAGSVWKSMFTDVMAEQLSKTEFTGLREAIRSSIPGHTTSSAGPAAKVSPGSEPVASADQTTTFETLQDVFSSLWQKIISTFDLAGHGDGTTAQVPGRDAR